MRIVGMVAAVSMAACVAGDAQPPTEPMRELAYVQGQTQWVGNGMIYSWARLDKTGAVTAIGVSFTEGMLSNLPEMNAE